HDMAEDRRARSRDGAYVSDRVAAPRDDWRGLKRLARLGQSLQGRHRIGKGPPRSLRAASVSLLDDGDSIRRRELEAGEEVEKALATLSCRGQHGIGRQAVRHAERGGCAVSEEGRAPRASAVFLLYI